jgi:hypothetical protein
MSVNVYLLGGRVKKVATGGARFRQKASFRDRTVSTVGTLRPDALTHPGRDAFGLLPGV